MSSLDARAPYELAKKCLFKLNSYESPGDFDDWEIYWLSGVMALRSVGHVLNSVDKTKSSRHQAIIDDHFQDLKNNKPYSPVYWEFLLSERNDILKEWNWKTKPRPHTISGWADQGLTYQEKVAKYGEWKDLEWEDGDNAIRLYEIALIFWHEAIHIIEQALQENVLNPFSGSYSIKRQLMENSNLVKEYPETQHL